MYSFDSSVHITAEAVAIDMHDEYPLVFTIIAPRPSLLLVDLVSEWILWTWVESTAVTVATCALGMSFAIDRWRFIRLLYLLSPLRLHSA